MNMVRPLCNVLMKVFFVTYYFVGMEHRIHFTHCSCEALSVTLARAELWPAPPRNPCCCFTFGLLDWAEALMLESQVSLKISATHLHFDVRSRFLRYTTYKMFTLALQCATISVFMKYVHNILLFRDGMFIPP